MNIKIKRNAYNKVKINSGGKNNDKRIFRRKLGSIILR